MAFCAGFKPLGRFERIAFWIINCGGFMKTCELYEKPFKVKSLCKEAVCEFMLCFLRKSSPYYCIEHLDRDANIHQDADGFWIGEINDIWDTDKEDREWEWERAMSDLRSIWIDGEQTEVKYLSL